CSAGSEGSNGANQPTPEFTAARGAAVLAIISSSRRLRTIGHGPRFSVLDHTSWSLLPEICDSAPAACVRNSFAAPMESSVRTRRNCSPPLDPSSMRESFISARRARGRTSQIRLSHPQRPSNSANGSDPEKEDERKLSLPRSCACRKTCNDMTGQSGPHIGRQRRFQRNFYRLAHDRIDLHPRYAAFSGFVAKRLPGRPDLSAAG